MAEEQASWNEAEKLVSEVFRDMQKQTKRWFIAFLLRLIVLVGTNA